MSHQATANHLGTLSTMVTGMSESTVDDTAARVATELGAVQGWQYVVNCFDRVDIALILAVGVRRFQEFKILMGKRANNDVMPFLRLAKIFGTNTRTVQECNASLKYCYTKTERGPQREPPCRLQMTLLKEGTTESTTDSTVTTSEGSVTTSSTRTTESTRDRDDLVDQPRYSQNTQLRSFSGPPTPPKGRIYEKLT